MHLIKVYLILLFIISLFSVSCSNPKSGPMGKIRGYVLLPDKIETATVPKEAKVYIYLQDYTPRNGKKVLPWEAPIKRVIEYEISSVKSHKIAFQFADLREGTYGVSVLVDTGRPHVLPGSLNFTAFPGDYAGCSKDIVKLEHNQIKEVSIGEWFYVTIPDGYEAPTYSAE